MLYFSMFKIIIIYTTIFFFNINNLYSSEFKHGLKLYNQNLTNTAINIFIKESNLNNFDAKDILLKIYYEQELNKRMNKRLYSYFLTSAKNEDSFFQVNIALILLKGIGVKQNIEAALFWLEKSAGNKNTNAKDILGWVYHQGVYKKQNFKKAYFWHQQAAKEGHTESQNSLGALYFHGRGVKQNYKIAASWYLRAVHSQNPYALTNLAVLYYKGLGVKKNRKKAKFLMKKAYDKKHPEALLLWKKFKLYKY